MSQDENLKTGLLSGHEVGAIDVSDFKFVNEHGWLVFCFSFFAIGVAAFPSLMLVYLISHGLANKWNFLFGTISSITSIGTTLWANWLSDRIVGFKHGGRRKPFILGGSILMGISAMVMAIIVPSIQKSRQGAVFSAFTFSFTIGQYCFLD